MNSDNQLLGKKRPFIHEEIIKKLKTMMKKFSKEIKKNSKCFKLSMNQENRIMKRLIQIIQDKSDESLYSVFRQEIGTKELEKIEDINEFTFPVINQIFSFKIKRRIYDIDSNKKLLRKNIWNYIQNEIWLLSDVQNIKSLDSEIKHKTKKEFEKNLMDTPIKDLYKAYYNINIEYMIQKIESGQKPTKKTKKNTEEELNSPYSNLKKTQKEKILRELLDKTFKDFFVMYRNSDQFWKDAEEDCSDDSQKLLNYLKIARKFINYVNISDKVNLDSLNEDSDLSEKFTQKYLFHRTRITKEQWDTNEHVNHSSNCTEEINYNNTTCSLANQINTIISKKSSNNKLESYFEVFKGLDIVEQKRINESLNEMMTHKNPKMNNFQNNDHSRNLSHEKDLMEWIQGDCDSVTMYWRKELENSFYPD
jgi:hypothetical protein